MSEVSEKFKDIMERREKVERKYDSKAKKEFSRPANYCQFCGKEMSPHADPTIERWQKRWSIHYDCAHAVDNRLDRSVGIVSERKQAQDQNEY